MIYIFFASNFQFFETIFIVVKTFKNLLLIEKHLFYRKIAIMILNFYWKVLNSQGKIDFKEVTKNLKKWH